jgi:Arylsulfotransferase (ASST)
MKRTLGVLFLGLALLVAGCDDDNGETKQVAAKPQKPEGPPPAPVQRFASRPDLKPPFIKVMTPASGTAPGYIFFAPKLGAFEAGPLIMDNNGDIVWYHPLKLTKGITDFRVQEYQGKPVLTWWRGRLSNVGVGNGWFVIYDDRYQPVAEVRPGNGLVGDVHDFVITEEDTALMTIYKRRKADLTSVKGPKDGWIWDNIVQEMDIKTRKVLHEWHSFPDVALDETLIRPPGEMTGGTKKTPYDYFHLNSIEVDDDGDLLVSARNTHAVYKIDRESGEIIWRLGGKKSDFALGPGVAFVWQHDARRQPDGTITIYDNGAAPPIHKFSRVLVLDVDEESKKATLLRSYAHPKKLLAPFEGNAQFLDNGNIFVGWGAWPYLTEFNRAGRVVFDVYFGSGKPPGQDADSYRGYRFPWVGNPVEAPAIKVERAPGGWAVAYVSWNGATELAKWQVVGGPDAENLKPLGKPVPKGGFETAIPVPGSAAVYAVQAVDKDGLVLRRSAVVRATG